MKKSLNKALKNYQEECQNMADTFIEWYYCDHDIKPSDVEWFWVAEQVGGVLCINDSFWGMNDLVDIFTLQPTESQLFDWKSECDEAAFRGKTSMNLRSWLKLNNTQDEKITKPCSCICHTDKLPMPPIQCALSCFSCKEKRVQVPMSGPVQESPAEWKDRELAAAREEGRRGGIEEAIKLCEEVYGDKWKDAEHCSCLGVAIDKLKRHYWRVHTVNRAYN